MKKIKDELESQEFYDLMQVYRHTPILYQKSTTKAFEDVKKYIRKLLKSSLTKQNENLNNYWFDRCKRIKKKTVEGCEQMEAFKKKHNKT